LFIDLKESIYSCPTLQFTSINKKICILFVEHLCISVGAKTFKSTPQQFGPSSRMMHTSSKETSRFQCEKCAYITNREYNLKRHIITRHKSNEEEMQSGSGLRCDKCEFTAQQRCRMKHHKLIKHTSDEEALWLQCEQCSYKTKLKCSLRDHMNLHKSDEEARWFYCFNCEYRTCRKGNFRRHMLVKHTTPEAVQWFACDKCPYQSKTKDR
jgi:hypothetical protein